MKKLNLFIYLIIIGLCNSCDKSLTNSMEITFVNSSNKDVKNVKFVGIQFDDSIGGNYIPNSDFLIFETGLLKAGTEIRYECDIRKIRRKNMKVLFDLVTDNDSIESLAIYTSISGNKASKMRNGVTLHITNEKKYVLYN
jgi:hypothetical protein